MTSAQSHLFPPARSLALLLGLCLTPLLPTLALAEGPPPVPGDGTLIATVNGQPYTLDVFRAFYAERLQQVQQAGGQDSPQLQELTFNEFLNLVVASQEGERRELESNPEVQGALEMQRLLVLSSAALQQIANEYEPSEADLRAAYDQFVAQAQRNEYKARHILVEDRDKALDLIKKLDKAKGKGFEKLAKEHSIANADQGGDLGWIDPRNMVPPLATAISELEPGQYTQQPVQTQFGWHVVLLEETRAAEPPAFEEAAAALETALRRQAVAEQLNQMRIDATVDLNEDIVRIRPEDMGDGE